MEIVAKRTKKLLEDKNINKKLSHSGEANGNAKLTEKDVIAIRQAYSKGQTFSEIYNLYKDKISYSGFQAVWRGKSW